MSDVENWPTPITAENYFLHQKKKLELADRRPVIRQASDLVGPGISGQALRLTNFDSLLASYNGYFAADVGANNAPNAFDRFAGFVTSDSEFGGWQMFKSLTTNVTYQRSFIRYPGDSETVLWGTWTSDEPVADTGWLALTLSAGYSALSGAFAPKYRIVGGVTKLRGGIQRGSVLVNGNTAATLPLAARPAAVVYPAIGTSYPLYVARLIVNTDGTLQASFDGTTTATWLSLDNVEFERAI